MTFSTITAKLKGSVATQTAPASDTQQYHKSVFSSQAIKKSKDNKSDCFYNERQENYITNKAIHSLRKRATAITDIKQQFIDALTQERKLAHSPGIFTASSVRQIYAENNFNIILEAWNTIEKYKRYPIGNRGMAAFFSTELMDHINTYRSDVVKEASVEHLYSNLEKVFENLEIYEEYLNPNNQIYLQSALASLLSCLTYYPKSGNKLNDKNKKLVQAAELFILWGTGRCENISALMYLLLASSKLRPLREILLSSDSNPRVAHSLIVIGGPDQINKGNFYQSDVFVVDYWSGCMGFARELFAETGPLYSFRQRTVTQQYYLAEATMPLPQFLFPQMIDVNEIANGTRMIFKKFNRMINEKANKNKKTPPNSTMYCLPGNYQKRANKVDYEEKYSCYCLANDPYDNARALNITKYLPKVALTMETDSKQNLSF